MLLADDLGMEGRRTGGRGGRGRGGRGRGRRRPGLPYVMPGMMGQDLGASGNDYEVSISFLIRRDAKCYLIFKI